MLLFRSLVLGLLCACLALLMVQPKIELRVVREVERPYVALAQPPTIIDVAPGVGIAELSALIHLAPGEHVARIDDAPGASVLDTGVTAAALGPGSRRFIDLDVAGPAGWRRVLVLLH